MPQDPPSDSIFEQRLIVLKHPHEVAYWTVVMAATEAELREAVRKAGPKVQDVRRYLEVVWRYLGKLPGNAGLPQDYGSPVAGPGITPT
jgi:hypothetical protein